MNSVSRVVILLLCFARGALAQEETPPPPTVADRGRLVEVFSGEGFYEGPAWDGVTAKLYFTAFEGARTRIMRLDAPGKAAVWLDNSEGINGTHLARDGRLLGAQVFGHRVMSYGIGRDAPSDARVLAENKKWNQPNDLCQTAKGFIYFTDPDFLNRKTSVIYLLRPDGTVQKTATNMACPNGLVASLDGKTLYVADSHAKHWRSYAIADDGALDEGKLFFEPKVESRADPDGMTIDSAGNLYCTGRGGVWVVDPTGKSLGFIPVPVFCTNVTFGGADGKTLYVTGDKKVYSLQMKIAGGRIGDVTAK